MFKVIINHAFFILDQSLSFNLYTQSKIQPFQLVQPNHNIQALAATKYSSRYTKSGINFFKKTRNGSADLVRLQKIQQRRMK